jgi:hypothetical protein
MSRQQHSKRDRGRQHVGLPPKQTAQRHTCHECGEDYWNTGAHMERCPGRPVREDFTGWYSCGCPGHGWVKTGGRCENLRDRRPVMRPQS